MGIFDFFKKKKPVNAPIDIVCTDDGGGGAQFAAENDSQIIFFHLSINNCMAQNDVYEGEIDENGVTLTHLLESSRWEGTKQITERDVVSSLSGDGELKRLVLELLESCKIESWDGFCGANPPGVLDGSSMCFSAKRLDGTKLEASGTNNFPKHYGEFCSALREIINYSEISKKDFGFHEMKLEVPDSWIGRITTQIQMDYICFMITKGKKQMPLLRVDYNSYGYTSEDSLQRVGRIVGIDKKGEEQTFFITLCPFDNFNSLKDLVDENEMEILDGIRDG